MEIRCKDRAFARSSRTVSGVARPSPAIRLCLSDFHITTLKEGRKKSSVGGEWSMTREQIKKSQISARMPRKVVMENGKPRNRPADTPMTRGENFEPVQ